MLRRIIDRLTGRKTVEQQEQDMLEAAVLRSFPNAGKGPTCAEMVAQDKRNAHRHELQSIAVMRDREARNRAAIEAKEAEWYRQWEAKQRARIQAEQAELQTKATAIKARLAELDAKNVERYGEDRSKWPTLEELEADVVDLRAQLAAAETEQGPELELER